MKIRIPKTAKANDLLQLFINNADIQTFHEILPTMNEVFISSINHENNSTQFQQAHE
jgi:ABC-type uncharacterized transport system ATPase subunit